MGGGLSVLTSLSSLDLPETDPRKCSHKFCEKWGPGHFHCADCHSTITDTNLMREEDLIIDGIVDESVPADGVDRGVTIQFLVDFCNSCNCWDMLTRDVRRRYIMPATRATRCRFVELPEMTGIVGKATTFVSHCWGAKFGDLVAALCDGGADRSRVVWVDIFAVRQWPSHKPDLDFSAVVCQCKSFMIVCSSFHEISDMTDEQRQAGASVIPLTIRTQIAFLRVWCLVEIHSAITSGANIIMKGGSFVRNDIGDVVFEANYRMLSVLGQLINIEEADATVPTDKARILGDIEVTTEGGLDFVNSTIRSILTGLLDEDTNDSYVPTIQCAACGDELALNELIKDPMEYIVVVVQCGYPDVLSKLLSHVDVKSWECDMLLIKAARWGQLACCECLIQSGVNINAKDELDGHTALIWAAYYGNLPLCEMLVKCGADVNAVSMYSNTPLLLAAIRGHLVCCDFLVNSGADITARSETGFTPLTYSLQYANEDCFNFFIGCGCNINERTSAELDSQTALILAAQSDLVACCETLIESGCDINAVDAVGWTALMRASEKGHKECCEVLIANDADRDIADTDGLTALMLAAQEGHTECCELLVNCNADLDVANNEGRTALMLAVVVGAVSCCEELIRGGASLSKVDIDGRTALHLAPSDDPACCDLLIRSACDLNVADKEGRTALINAALGGYLSCCDLLIKAGADLNAVDAKWRTALVCAVLHGRATCCLNLIDAGACLDMKAIDGRTALHCSIRSDENAPCCELLVKAGADLNATDIKGRTALIIAAEEGYYSCCELLVNAGADVNVLDSKGRTALIWASIYNRVTCCELLIKARTNLEVIDDNGRTALKWASVNSHTSCVELFSKI